MKYLFFELLFHLLKYSYQERSCGHTYDDLYLIDIDVTDEEFTAQYHNQSYRFKLYNIGGASTRKLQVNLRDGSFESSAESGVKVFIPEIKEMYENSKLIDLAALNYRLELLRPFCCLDPRIQVAIVCSPKFPHSAGHVSADKHISPIRVACLNSDYHV